MKHISFIGTGMMGAFMAGHLLDAGYELHVYNRTKEKAMGLIGRGAIWHDTAGECAAQGEAVFTIVGTPQDVQALYFGAGGILESARPGAYLIDMTTSSPSLSKKIEAAAREKGLFALDAPVTGGDIGAKNGTLTMMIGGNEAAVSACMPLFSCMGKNIVHLGGPGAGMHCKMANQIAYAGVIAGIAEAFAYVRAAGVDEQKVYDCISQGVAKSWQMEHRAPNMLKGEFSPTFYLRHFLKDLGLAKDSAAENGTDLPALSAIFGMYEELCERGFGELGSLALIKYFEKE